MTISPLDTFISNKLSKDCDACLTLSAASFREEGRGLTPTALHSLVVSPISLMTAKTLEGHRL